MFSRKQLFVDGIWMDPSDSAPIDVVSPITEAVIGRAPRATTGDIDRAVDAARRAFDSGPWARMTGDERAGYLTAMAEHIRPRSEEIARLIVAEVGSPWKFMEPIVQGPVALMSYYADLARSFRFDEFRKGLALDCLIRHEPIGVVAAIVPWNTPFWLAVQKVAPALAAGCAVILKPAEETPLDAFALADAAIAAGLPPGVLNILPADRATSAHLVSHSGVDKLSFTGSTSAGRRIASICGGDVRRVTLELGGKSAAILLDDAVLDDAVPKIVSFGLAWNNGQACSALTRILAPRSRYDSVVEAICDYVRKLIVGDPSHADTDIGPVISARQRERVEAYIEWGRADGATVQIGGRRPQNCRRGWFIEPTVFRDVRNDMRIAREEIFGPVGVVIPYDGEDEAIAIANDSPYGLAGAVFTRDGARGLAVAKQVRTGIYGINMLAVDIACPFGGRKQSGVGREMGEEGLTSFLETKSIFGAPRS